MMAKTDFCPVRYDFCPELAVIRPEIVKSAKIDYLFMLKQLLYMDLDFWRAS